MGVVRYYNLVFIAAANVEAADPPTLLLSKRKVPYQSYLCVALINLITTITTSLLSGVRVCITISHVCWWTKVLFWCVSYTLVFTQIKCPIFLLNMGVIYLNSIIVYYVST